jgi:hypothetical protein
MGVLLHRQPLHPAPAHRILTFVNGGLMRRRPRVYYSLLADGLIASLLPLLVLMGGARADAQIGLTVAPAMTRGAAGAPVTIVEFSDYQ